MWKEDCQIIFLGQKNLKTEARARSELRLKMQSYTADFTRPRPVVAGYRLEAYATYGVIRIIKRNSMQKSFSNLVGHIREISNE
jgi:hypothetical protein